MGHFLSCVVPSLKEGGDASPAALRAAMPAGGRVPWPVHRARPSSDTRFAALGAAVPV